MMRVNYRNYINLIDKRLTEIVRNYHTSTLLQESVLYSITAGGKRFRPLIVLLLLKDLDQDIERGLDIACAIEMIHTYALIHDDLPAMDNDDFRRGKLTNHLVFGEAVAILAGDALLTESFNVIANAKNINNEEKIELIKIISARSGANGMVGGQVLDISSVNEDIDFEQIKLIHQKKTKELIEAALFSGAILAGIYNDNKEGLYELSEKLGVAFQVQDDLFDIFKDKDTLGKSPGSDERNKKSTFPVVLGIAETKEYYFNLRNESLQIIADLFGKKDLYKLIEGVLHEEF